MDGFWALSTIPATDPSATGFGIPQNPDASAWRRCPTPGTGKSQFPPLPAFLKHPLRKYCEKKLDRTLHKCCLSGLISLALCAPVPAVYAASIETGYSPEGTALQLVLKTIDSAQQEIRLMGYSFTSPEVAGALVRAKRRGVDVKVVLDWKANTGKQTRRAWRP